MTLDTLIDRWTAEAITLRIYGAREQAVVLEVCIRELREALEKSPRVLQDLATRPQEWSPF